MPTEIAGELAVLETSVARFRGDTPRTLKLARRALEVLRDDQPELQLSVYMALGVAYHQQGAPEEAAEALHKASQLGETSDRGRYGALAALEELATLQIRRGQLAEAAHACGRGIDLFARWGQTAMPAAGLTQVVLGEVLCERNDLDGASRSLARGLALLPGLGEPILLARGHVALARVRQAQGDPTGALATIARGESWLAQQRVPSQDALAHLAAYRARLGLAQGDAADALAWARESVMEGESELAYFRALTLVRYHLAQTRIGPDGLALLDALTTLEQLRASAELVGWHGHLIEILILRALARQIEGNQVLAVLTLGQALALAAPEGYARVFLDEGAPVQALLARWIAERGDMDRDVQEGAIDAHARHLQAVSSLATQYVTPGSSGTSAAMPGALTESLSERELAVLRLMADGRANPEIAAELLVATSTVKWYVNSLFSKLAVTSRTQAVARARALGLLTG